MHDHDITKLKRNQHVKIYLDSVIPLKTVRESVCIEQETTDAINTRGVRPLILSHALLTIYSEGYIATGLGK